MMILDANGGGRFLSEALPDLFPEAGISDTEQLLWIKFYSDKKAQIDG